MSGTAIYLEMPTPAHLIPAGPPPTPLEFEEVTPTSASLMRTTYNSIFETDGRLSWSDQQWADELSLPGVRAWIARVDSTVAGLVELEVEPNGDVGIVVFGLVPELRGKGFGGAFLTLATQTAWQLASSSGRVWLQTSTADHPHALPNYQRRGFRIFDAGTRSTG